MMNAMNMIIAAVSPRPGRITRARPLLAVVLLGIFCNAQAASVSLVPTSAVDVPPGGFVSFDIVMNFTGEPTLSGGFDIEYDSTALQIVSLVRDPAVGEADFSRDPDVLPDLLGNWAVGGFSGLADVATLGSITFQATGGSSVVAVRPASGVAGPWISNTDFLTVLNPAYNQVQVTDTTADTDGDGILDVNDTDDDNDGLSDADENAAGLNPVDPDSDDDGIGDGNDTSPLTPSNACTGGDEANATLQGNVETDRTCAARESVTVLPPTSVQDPGHLRLISPTVVLRSGFEADRLTVTSADPCPGCPLPEAAGYEYAGVVTLCTDTCFSFDALAVGSEISGGFDIDTTPGGSFGDAEMGDFMLSIFNPALPVSGPFGNPATDNPLLLDSASGVIASNGTAGTTDAANELAGGQMLLEFLTPPFSDNGAFVVFDLATADGQVCLFFATAGCIPAATEVIRTEGNFF